MAFNPQDPYSNGPVVYQSVLELCFMIYKTPEAVQWLRESNTNHTLRGGHGGETFSVEFYNKQDAALFKLMFT